MFTDTDDGRTIAIDTPMIAFEVVGKPISQGNKSAWRGRVVEQNKEKLMPWRQLIAQVAGEKWGDRDLLDCALEVVYEFRFARPDDHTGTGRNAGVLKASKPKRWQAFKPDAEKLVRAVNDALTGVVWKDDSRVASQIVRKLWTTGSEGASIKVYRLDN